MTHAQDCSTAFGHRLCNCQAIKWCAACEAYVTPYDYEEVHRAHDDGFRAKKGWPPCSADR